jgi:U3 small nucleolar ribonucleoprotein component
MYQLKTETEQEQGVAGAGERGLNLPEDMDHDDNSSVNTTIYEEDWHDKANDHSLRKRVGMNIHKALVTEFKLKNKYSDEWRRKLPLLAHRLESMHYHKSPTREVYLDINPKKMKNSLKCLATSIYFQQLTAEAKFGRIECDCSECDC